MNKKLYTITIASLMITILSGCSKTEFKVNNKALVVELGNEVSSKAKTYLSKDNSEEVLNKATMQFKEEKKYMMDTKKNILATKKGEFLPVGSYKASLKYEDVKKSIVIKVKDTKAPTFVDFKEEIEVEAESTVDLATYYKADDLSETTISIEKGKLDLSKEGTYEIKVTATDKYKNKETKKSSIKVVAKAVAEEPGQAGSNNQTSVPSGTGGGNNTSNGTATPPTTGGGSGSNTGDVCTPEAHEYLFSSFEEANKFAESFILGKENSDKGYDNISGNHAYTYGVGSAGCGNYYVTFWYE